MARVDFSLVKAKGATSQCPLNTQLSDGLSECNLCTLSNSPKYLLETSWVSFREPGHGGKVSQKMTVGQLSNRLHLFNYLTIIYDI